MSLVAPEADVRGSLDALIDLYVSHVTLSFDAVELFSDAEHGAG